MNFDARLVAVSAFAGLVFFISGCASVPMATADKDAKSKEFLPAPNRASLYIYRNENFGAAIPMSVSVNKRALGQTAAKTFFQLNVVPGKYTVESSAENVSTLDLTVAAGQNYFVWQEVKMGMWSARSMLHQVDESTGKAGVAESKLVAVSIPDGDLGPLDKPVAAPVASPASPIDSLSQQLQELENLRKSKSISEEEYQKMRAGLIDKYQK